MRIKALQALYHFELEQDFTVEKSIKSFDRSIHLIYELYLFHLLAIRDLSDYALIDAQRVATKHIKASHQEMVSTKIVENPLARFLNLPKQKLIFEKWRTPSLDNDMILKDLYQSLKEQEFYIHYVNSEDSIKNEESFLKDLYNQFLLKNELFLQQTEDLFPNFNDDDDIIISQININIRSIKKIKFDEDGNTSFSLSTLQLSTINAMCYPLIRETIQHRDEYQQIILPHLKNWEADRIALMDKIIMNMILTEWLYLPEIPIKVTINEYIDISHMYSTPKSSDFINGIMDSIRRDLVARKEIRKTGDGLKEH